MVKTITFILFSTIIVNSALSEQIKNHIDMVDYINNLTKTVTFIRNYPNEFLKIADSVGEITDVRNFIRYISFSHPVNVISNEIAANTTDLPRTSTEVSPFLPPNQEISELCRNHTEALTKGFNEQKPWALRMVDAAGKPPSNILGGSTLWLGDYDECLDVAAEEILGNITYKFAGQYCKVTVPVDGDLAKFIRRLTVGICVPNSCSETDVINLINAANGTLTASSSTCQEPDISFDTRAIIVLVVVSLFMTLMTLGTAYDIILIQWPKWRKQAVKIEQPVEADEKAPLIDSNVELYNHEPGLVGKLLLSFSIYTNGGKILSTEQSKETITCINGIRFISMTWVILGHGYIVPLSISDNVATALPKLKERISFSIITNSFVSVDSFFTLSGLLLTYLVMKELEKNKGKMKWGMFYFHRFWRLTPPYMLILMVYVSLFPYTGSGPLWDKDGPEPNYCKDAWYYNFLYINNFIDDSKKTCMVWTWYLANDMQFFILSPLIILPLYYSHKVGVGVLSLFLLGTWITTGVTSSTYDIGAGGFDQGEHRSKIYDRPYCRMGPYLVGMYTGYLLYKCRCNFKINRWINLLCWATSAVVACLILYGLHDDMNGHPLSTEVAALYNTVHRTVWGACVAWVIFACATGYGGYANTILSWKGFVPLSKLTYMAYLTHMIVQTYFRLTQRKLIHLTDIEIVYEFLGHVCISYSVAFITSLAFESPMLGLERVLLKREERKR